MKLVTTILIELSVELDVLIEPAQYGSCDKYGAKEEPDIPAFWEIDGITVLGDKMKGSGIELNYEGLSKSEKEEIAAAVEEEMQPKSYFEAKEDNRFEDTI